MTKTLKGELLGLDDAPAHGRDLLVVDGNNLAHRAFHALPEGIATSWGLPSNALLGFANLFFKLLCDYRPRGAVVAWDRKPTERLAAASSYKAGRKAMAETLARQIPTLAARAEAAGRLPAGLGGDLPDDDAARRGRSAGVHAGPRGRALRDRPGAHPGLHRAEGRQRRQHRAGARHR